MAFTPIGPFCPFRSESANQVEPKMMELQEQASDFSSDMEQLQLDMQFGDEPPDKERLFRLAEGIDVAVEQWEIMNARLKLSGDFQTTEYNKLMLAHLASHGVTPSILVTMMKWQGGCMRAMGLGAPPPMPPPEIDIQRLIQQGASQKPPPSLSAMTAAEAITSQPFDETALKNEAIKEEYQTLCRDHDQLIQLGSQYSTFDPLGKFAFLDEIEKVEDRWDVFFKRFSLMGELNPRFTEQCNAFLESMNLDEKQYRKLLKKAHDLMRQDAEAQRNAMVYH